MRKLAQGKKALNLTLTRSEAVAWRGAPHMYSQCEVLTGLCALPCPDKVHHFRILDAACTNARSSKLNAERLLRHDVGHRQLSAIGNRQLKGGLLIAVGAYMIISRPPALQAGTGGWQMALLICHMCCCACPKDAALLRFLDLPDRTQSL